MQNIEDIYELSPLQQGMLFHSLYDSEPGMYCQQLICKFSRGFDRSAFQQAWQLVVDRHTILRTSFHWKEAGKPLQVVHKRVELACNQMDWRRLSEDEQQSRLPAFMMEDRDAGYDFSSPPLMRLTLIRSADDLYRFILSIHHLLVDGWSLFNLIKEVFIFYESLCGGQQVSLEPARPYRTYIEFLQQQDMSGAEAFWRNALAGYDSPTSVIDYEVLRSENENPNDCAIEQLVVSSVTMARLQNFAREQKLTLNTILQAAWALILGRYSGQQDVVYGTVVSARPSIFPDIRTMVGLFINTLPMRVRVTAQDTLLLWLKSLQDFLVQIRQYEYSSLVDVQGWSEIPRARQLFETVFVFENYPFDKSLQLASSLFQIDDVRFINRNNYPLTLIVVPGQELSLQIMYYRNRFSAAFVTQMLNGIKILIESMLFNPMQHLSQLSLLSEAEKRQLLADGCGRRVESPEPHCLHHLFESQVAKTPDAIAIVFKEQQITYHDLNAKANRLAHQLRSIGVCAETRVAIFMERSSEIVLALLAALKAGGAYVPLDVRSPKGRITMMLNEIAPRAVLIQSHFTDYLADCNWRLVTIDEVINDADQSSQNPDPIAAIENTAYVLFTSGSTGMPKGVMIEHRQIFNYLNAIVERLQLSDVSSFAMVTSFSSDLANTVIFPSLCLGGRLHVISEETASNPKALVDYFSRYPIDVLKIVPSHVNALISLIEARSLLPRQCLILGGEAAHWELIEKIKLLAPELAIYNHYGPTETTVGVITYQIEERSASNAIPLGLPLSKVETYISSSDWGLMPKLVAGELYIGGACVGRGYINRAELTAERFIPNPYATEAGSRIYKTGDLAYYRLDGNLEFLGRADNQLKIRGFRIELGEIEAALSSHPAVLNAVVMAKQDPSGENRLLAFVTTNDKQEGLVAELRSALMQRIPDYMLPSAIVVLDRMPITPSGKIDRQGLLSMNGIRGQAQVLETAATVVLDRMPITFNGNIDRQGSLSMNGIPGKAQVSETAATFVEEILGGIWAELLKIERADRNSNFFELGGHSLKAMQLVSRVREAFQIELTFRTIFEAPTIAELSRRIETLIKSRIPVSAPPITPIPRTGPLPLSFAQQRLWFLNRLMPDSPYYNVPAAIHLKGKLDLEAFERTITEIIRRHETLRTTFSTIDGQPTQVIRPVQPVSLPTIDLTEIPGYERESVARQAADVTANIPFDLAEGPLLRLLMIRIDEDEYIAVWILHHIVCDNWTTGVLVKEVSVLYAAFSAGETSPLPEIEIQYADYAFWQRQWLQGEVLESQLAYWKKQLDGAPRLLQLPTDRPRPAVQTFRGANEPFTISLELTQSVKALSRQSEVTLYMILLAAYKTLLFRHTGQTKIVVGTPIANRNRVEVEQLIGFFVNMMVICTELSGDMTFVELLGKVREEVLGAYAYQDLPFEMLVDELHPERDLSYTPIVQTVLVLQNAPSETLNISSLSLRPVEVHSATSMFDLILGIGDTPQGLIGNATYNTDLFERETINELLDNYVALLREILADPYCRLIDIPLPTYSRDGFFETGSTLDSRYEGEQFNFR